MSTDFALLPAIDLRGGRVVRLVRGDFDRETAYGDDPAAVADRFSSAGAGWLHVVDLDGARAGEPRQADVVRSIIDAVAGRAKVEVAGGLRTREVVRAALSAGAHRVVVGTAALRDPSLAGALVKEFGWDRIAVALDVRDGEAVGEGWRTDASGIVATEVMTRLAAEGVACFEVTAIERDGTLEGPDLRLLEQLVPSTSAHVIASGGVSSVEDLVAVRAIGCAGAIVGRALYEGGIDLAEAQRTLATGQPDQRPDQSSIA